MPPPMFPSVARSTPRMLIARDSMAWSPICRALSIARSANGTDSAARPASMRLAARPARRVHGRSTAAFPRAVRQLPRGRIEVAVSPASQAADPNRSRALARRSRSPSGPGIAVDERRSPSAQGRRPARRRRQGRCRARGIEQVGEVTVGRLGRPRAPGPRARSRARTGAPPRRRRRRPARRRLPRSRPRARERVVGSRPVMRELHQPAGLGRAAACGAGVDGAGVCGVEAAPLGRQQLVVRGFLDQRVAELVALRRFVEVDDEQLRVNGFMEGRSASRPRTAPHTSARTSCSTCRPATAATSTSRPAMADAAERRTSRTPRSVSGRRTRPWPSRLAAATSSSAKKALPSDRRAMESTQHGGGRRADDPVSNSTSSERSNRERSTRSTRGWRSASASQAVSGWRRCSSSVAEGGDDEAAARHAHCASGTPAGREWSDPPSAGPRDEHDRRRLARAGPSSRRTPSKMRIWSHSGSPDEVDASPATPESSGTSRASSGRLGPAAAAMRSASTPRPRTRRASTMGPNGRRRLPSRPSRPRGRAIRRRGAWRPPPPRGGSCRHRLRRLRARAGPRRTRQRRPSRGALPAPAIDRRRPGWTGGGPCRRMIGPGWRPSPPSTPEEGANQVVRCRMGCSGQRSGRRPGECG